MKAKRIKDNRELKLESDLEKAQKKLYEYRRSVNEKMIGKYIQGSNYVAVITDVEDNGDLKVIKVVNEMYEIGIRGNSKVWADFSDYHEISEEEYNKYLNIVIKSMILKHTEFLARIK